MHRIAWCTAAAVLAMTVSASATFIATLSSDDQFIAPEGRWVDVTVTLSRDLTDGGNGISGVAMNFVASSDRPFNIELGGVEGSAGSSGTGTRYNSAEWDSDVIFGWALDPDLAAGRITETPRGPIGTGYATGLWSSSTSVMAILRVFVSGLVEGQEVTLAPANVQAFPDYDTQFDVIDGQGVGVTFIGVPEPAGISLALLAFGWIARRR